MFGRTNKRERCQHGYRHSVERSDLLSLPVRRRLHGGARRPVKPGRPAPRSLDFSTGSARPSRARRYSHRTEKAYIHWIKRYIFFHGKRHPVEMGAPEVTAFLTSLAVHDRVAASTQNQATARSLRRQHHDDLRARSNQPGSAAPRTGCSCHDAAGAGTHIGLAAEALL